MEVKLIENKNIWEDFLKNKEKTFLHSWNWGKFQESLGGKIFRLGFFKENQFLGVSLVIGIKAKRGNFLLIPHGPIIKNSTKTLKIEILKEIIIFIKKLNKDKFYSFLRIAPIFKDSQENKEIFKSLHFKKAPLHIHPEITWLVDISKPEEKIFASFRKVHRNLIRRAERENVVIEKIDNIENAVNNFYNLYIETSKRQKFVPFSKEYLKNEFKSFLKDNQILGFFAKHQGEILSGAFVIFYGKTAYYHQGASIHSKIPSPYLLQWEIIKEAKKRGCSSYNMWGVAPINKETYLKQIENKKKINPTTLFNKNHPWYGLSLFKTGFNGKVKFYLKTQDFPLKISYLKNWLVEKARKTKRRY